MKIAFYPFEAPNEYINQIIKAIHLAYSSAEVIPFPSTKEIIRNKIRYEIVWLNWFENISCKSTKLFVKGLLRNIICLLYWKIKGIKIITVFHNRNPHEMKYPFLNQWCFNVQLRLSTKIIVLSDLSKTILDKRLGTKILEKIVKIPHPRYECIEKEYPILPGDFTVLFFGLLRPYKNIELIIELAKKYTSAKFTIAGKPESEMYGKQLQKLTQNIPNLTLKLGFLSDPELDFLINEASILILPYDIRSSLNSGVVYYACSKGINIIVPRIGSVDEIDTSNNIYSYSYDSPSDHFFQLCKTMDKALYDYHNNYEKFKSSAKKLRKKVYEKNSPMAIAQEIFKLTL